jgi:hypothetical protein
MKDFVPYIAFFIFLYIALISTILYFAFTDKDFVLQSSFLIVAIFFSTVSIIIMTILFIKHKKPWTNIQIMNYIIGYMIAIFVVILCAILLNRLLILEQGIWYTLPTMLLYEKGCEIYSNSNILVNSIKPLQETFQEYKANTILKKNANLDIITRIVMLSFMNTSKIILQLPKQLFSYTYFTIQLLSLDGTVIQTITNYNKTNQDYTFQFNSPFHSFKDGINTPSIVAYLYMNIHYDIHSESSYSTIQSLMDEIHFTVDNATTNKNTLDGIYPNILKNKNFNIRQNRNISPLDYFEGFCDIKSLQIKNINNFWLSNMSEIGIKNGYYETTYYYRLTPLFRSTLNLLKDKSKEQSQKKGWISFVNNKKMEKKDSLKNQIYKTVLYWFYNTPIVSKTHVYITRTDNRGILLDGNFGNYTFSLEKTSIEFSKFGFWSISVFDTETNILPSLKSYYSSIKLTSIKFGTDLDNVDIIIPKSSFYVILKLFDLSSTVSKNDIPSLKIL